MAFSFGAAKLGGFGGGFGAKPTPTAAGGYNCHSYKPLPQRQDYMGRAGTNEHEYLPLEEYEEKCPPGWTVRVSESKERGRPYWVRIGDGHRQWEPPSPFPWRELCVALVVIACVAWHPAGSTEPFGPAAVLSLGGSLASGLLCAASMALKLVMLTLMLCGLCCLAVCVGLPEDLRQTITLATLPQHCKTFARQNIQRVLGEDPREGSLFRPGEYTRQLCVLQRENGALQQENGALHQENIELRAHAGGRLRRAQDRSGMTARAVRNYAEFHGIPILNVDRSTVELSSAGLAGWARQVGQSNDGYATHGQASFGATQGFGTRAPEGVGPAAIRAESDFGGFGATAEGTATTPGDSGVSVPLQTLVAEKSAAAHTTAEASPAAAADPARPCLAIAATAADPRRVSAQPPAGTNDALGGAFNTAGQSNSDPARAAAPVAPVSVDVGAEWTAAEWMALRAKSTAGGTFSGQEPCATTTPEERTSLEAASAINLPAEFTVRTDGCLVTTAGHVHRSSAFTCDGCGAGLSAGAKVYGCRKEDDWDLCKVCVASLTPQHVADSAFDLGALQQRLRVADNGPFAGLTEAEAHARLDLMSLPEPYAKLAAYRGAEAHLDAEAEKAVRLDELSWQEVPAPVSAWGDEDAEDVPDSWDAAGTTLDLVAVESDAASIETDGAAEPATTLCYNSSLGCLVEALADPQERATEDSASSDTSVSSLPWNRERAAFEAAHTAIGATMAQHAQNEIDEAAAVAASVPLAATTTHGAAQEVEGHVAPPDGTTTMVLPRGDYHDGGATRWRGVPSANVWLPHPNVAKLQAMGFGEAAAVAAAAHHGDDLMAAVDALIRQEFQ